MSSACDYAWSKGSICVVSAGNQQFFRTDYQDAHAIIVTATGPDDSKASYATGDGLAPWGLAAPGGTDTDGTASEIVSTYWSQAHGDGYAYAMGTSMAAPHVSGAAAILRGLGLTPQETVDRLLQTATNIGSSLTFGHGLLNIAAAVDGLRAKRASSGGASSGPVSETTPNAPAASSSVGSGRSASTATTTKRGTPTTTASSEPVTTTPAGLALFSPEPQRRTGKGIGWTVGAVVLCLGAAGAGIFTYRLRRGSS
jgi:serine protease